MKDKKRTTKEFNIWRRIPALKRLTSGLSDWQLRIITVVLFGIIALLVELFVFNYKHWTTLFYKPFSAQSIVAGDGLHLQEDGTYLTSDGEKYLFFTGFSDTVKNAYVEVTRVDELGSDNGSRIRVDFDGSDESHTSLYSMSQRIISSREKRSFYVTFHFYGKAKLISMRMYPANDVNVIANVRFNVPVPLFIYFSRIVLLWAILVFIYFFRPSSILHRIKYLSIKPAWRISILVGFFVINALILLWVNKLNGFYQSENGVNTEQYQELAEAFSAGQLSVLDEPPQALKDLENPYDMSARNEVMEFGEWYFDHAYYNGKYYVYFGVVPAVILYWPYYLLTGEHIHNHTVCYIGILIILAGILLVYDETVKRYARNCSVALWFLLAEFTIVGSYIVYVTKRPDLYSVPIIYAVAFSFMGVWAYMKALPARKKDVGTRLNKMYLVFGSVFMAMIVGCRPQIFPVVLLGVIILRRYCFNLNYLKSRDGVLALVSVFVPMAVIGGLLMVYNARRFGSPFDFGAFYNLTFNDMRKRGWVWDRIPLGTVIYLFHPMNFVPEYPYFGNIYVETRYMGATIWETTYGGIFMSSPFSLFALTSLFYWKKLKKKSTIWMLSVASIAVALLVMVFDTVNSGILARYFFDFSFLWMIAASLSALNLMGLKEIKKSELKNTLIWIFVAIMIFEIIYQCLVFMLDSGDYLMGNRQDLFYHLYYMFGFAM